MSGTALMVEAVFHMCMLLLFVINVCILTSFALLLTSIVFNPFSYPSLDK